MTQLDHVKSSIPCVITLIGGLTFTVLAYNLGMGRVELAAMIAGTLMLLVLLDMRVGVIACMYYLALMGDLRRLIPSPVGSVDPMLLVGPAVAGLLLLRMMLAGELRLDSTISKLCAVLLCLMIIQIFNPIQGNWTVGLAGAVFYLVPLLWFFIGKALARGGIGRTLIWYYLIPISVAALALGMFQTFVGFLSFEAHWIRTSGYTALGLGDGKVRAFGFFVSAQEYAVFLSLASVALIATLIARRIRWTILLLPLLVVGLFLESSRQHIVLLLAAACAMWGALAKTNQGAILRMGIAAAIMVVVLITGLNQLQDVDVPESIRPQFQHTASGLLDPGHSSAVGHAEEFRDGIVSGFKRPFGEGLGVTTGMSSALHPTECDISDMFVCLGIGGLLYAAVIALGLYNAVLHFRTVRTISALACVGALVATLGAWISGSAYAAAPLVCLLLGSMDGAMQSRPIEAPRQWADRSRPRFPDHQLEPQDLQQTPPQAKSGRQISGRPASSPLG